MEAQLSNLSVGNVVAILIFKVYLCLYSRIADRAHLIGLIDLEESYGKSALARRIDIDKFNVLKIQIIGRLRTDEEHS